MKFIIDEKGMLVPAKEPVLIRKVIRHTKPVAKIVILTSIVLGVGWLIVHFFPVTTLPFQSLLSPLQHASSFQEAFTNIVQAKGF